MANEADEWRTPNFRQKVTNQIDEALRKSGNPQMMTKNASDIERDVFSKAKSRDEYMCYVARVLVFARDISTGRTQAGVRPGLQPGQPGQVMQHVNIARQMIPGIAGQPMRQQFSVTQMSTAPSMTSSVANPQYQQGKPQMQFKIMSSMQQPQMNAQAITISQAMVSQPQQFAMTGTPTLQVQTQPQNHMPGPAVSSQHPSSQMNLSYSQPSFSVSSAGGTHLIQHQSPAMQTTGRPSNPSPAVPTVVPSPAFNTMNSPVPAQHGMTPSPQTFIAQSPAPQSVPTPGIPNVQSPASILNGPASVGPPVTSPAPLSAAEEQAYLEKHKQLSMYIEPLTRMINRMNQEHSKHSTSDLKKLKNFLDILENPARRVSLSVLEKCEQVLKKLNLKTPSQRMGATVSPSPSTASAQVTSKSTVISSSTKPFAFSAEEHGQALLETVVKHLKSPLFSHTLKRTFSPIVQAMEGPPICPPPPPTKKIRLTELTTKKCPLPHALQGELARLCNRFSVKPDVDSSNSESSMLLTCSIQDNLLPAVPPIEVTVPQNYPHSSPACKTKAYETTPFLLKIQSQLLSELRRMPGFYSVTSLLNAWEASIRLACLSEVTVSV